MNTNWKLRIKFLLIKKKLLTIFIRKTVFYSIPYKSGSSAASEFFHMFEQLIKFYTIHYHLLRVEIFEIPDPSGRQ